MLLIPQESSIEVQPLGTKFIPSSPDTMKWKKKKGGQRNKANPVAANTSKKAKLQRQYVSVATRRNIGRETVPSTWQKERRPNKLVTGEVTMRVGTGQVISAISVGGL
ncbi:uncharacterized protein E6C27_scaffold25G001070 [Cucumis melo var. makuwa]|uniref:Uncharacterized protein n=1 Tax=Cucumis melo var. makuwa TaxID=1194695 RepID=A0A5A7VJN5_CUCMM|nr:uncharacterized protein E6C27_scaffold25G001070 [Cucumis melo var. makuwa]